MTISPAKSAPSPTPVGVGIVGLSAHGNWAAGSHLPALRAVDGFELRGLSASSKDSAALAGQKYDVPLVFGSAAELAAHPDIDLVVIAVKVPHHRELVTAAIEADKAVLCEWPLGNGLAETVDLAALANVRGVRTAVGLQARSSPFFRYARDLIADGYVGEVLSTSIVASGSGWGGTLPAGPPVYSLDASNGVTMLTIPMGHTLDAAGFLLGELSDIRATAATRRPQILDEATGLKVPMTVADQVAVTGRFENGAVASVHFRGGLSRSTNLLWEINGTEGDLVITGAMGHVQLVELTLRGARGDDRGTVELPVPPEYHLVAGVSQSARIANVANAYALLREDWTNGTTLVPTFEHSVLLHRTIDAIARAGGISG